MPNSAIVVPPLQGATHLTPRYQEIGGEFAHGIAQAAQANDIQFAQHLASKGIAPEDFAQYTPDQMNRFRQEINAAYGKKYTMSKRGEEAFKQDVIA